MSRLSTKLITVGLYLTLLLPLAFTPFTFLPWHFGKTIIFQIIVETMILLWLAIQLPDTNFRLKVKGLNWLDWSVIGFLIILTITSLTGVNPVNSFWSDQARANGVFTWWHFGAWYFLLKGVLHSSRQARDQEKLAIGIISTAVALAVSVTIFFPSILPVSWQGGSGGGIIGNRAFAASYLLMSFGLALYLLFTSRLWQWRLAFFGSAAILGAALVVLRNRGALFGIGVGLVAVTLLLIIFGKDKRARLAGVVVGAMVATLLATLFFVQPVRNLWPALAELVRHPGVVMQEGTAATRLLAWRIAWNGFLARPILGWGMGNFSVIFNQYYQPQFLKFGFSETVWDKPHNWLLELADGAGVLGAASYLVIMGVAVWFALREPKEEVSAATSVGGIILAATLIAYFAQSFFLFETSNSLWLFFFLLALISFAQSAKETPANFGSVGMGGSHLNRFRSLFFILYSLFFIFIVFKYSYLPLKVSYYLSRARSFDNTEIWADNALKTLSTPVSFRMENGIFLAERFVQLDKAGAPLEASSTVAAARTVANALEEEARHQSANPLPLAWAGQVYLALGEKVSAVYYLKAEELFKDAIKLSPNKQEWRFFLGRLYLLEKKFDQAILAHKEAVALAPDIGVSHWFLGVAEAAAGDSKAALSEIELAESHGYSFNRDQELYVLDLYAEEKNYAKVIAGYTKLLEAEPENVTWYVRLATAYALAGDKPKALEIVDRVVKFFPTIKGEAEKFIKQYKLR